MKLVIGTFCESTVIRCVKFYNLRERKTGHFSRETNTKVRGLSPNCQMYISFLEQTNRSLLIQNIQTQVAKKSVEEKKEKSDKHQGSNSSFTLSWIFKDGQTKW